MGESSATTTSKSKYFTKTVRFGGKELILYSLDGATWSTRRQELAAIKERQEAQRITLADIKGTDEAEEDRSSEEDSESSNDEGPVILNDDDEETEEEAPARKPVAAPAVPAKARVTALPPPSERKLKQVIPAKAKSAQKEKLQAKKPAVVKAAVKSPAKKAKPTKLQPKKAGKSKPGLVKGRKKAA